VCLVPRGRCVVLPLLPLQLMFRRRAISAVWWSCERGVSAGCCGISMSSASDSDEYSKWRKGWGFVGFLVGVTGSCADVGSSGRGVFCLDGRGGRVEETGYFPSGVGLDFPWSAVN
jgi:hypothetical protein